jgi:hypothetical protein
MDKSKYGKYIINDTSKFKMEAPLPDDPNVDHNFLVMNDDAVKGSYFLRATWFWATPPTGHRRGGHVHEWDELLGFFGTVRRNPQDLGGEVHFWIDDEEHVLTKSSLIFLPKGLKHGPLFVKRVDTPIFHFSSGLSGKYNAGTQFFDKE